MEVRNVLKTQFLLWDMCNKTEQLGIEVLEFDMEEETIDLILMNGNYEQKFQLVIRKESAIELAKLILYRYETI